MTGVKSSKEKIRNKIKFVIKKSTIKAIKNGFRNAVISRNMSHYQRRNMLIAANTAGTDFHRSIRNQRSDFSKWLLGGAIAFLYYFISDKEKVIVTYGLWQTKIMFFVLLFSVYNGLVMIGTVRALSFVEKENYLKFYGNYIYLEKAKNPDGRAGEIPPSDFDLESYEKYVAEKICDDLKFIFLDISNLVYQAIAFFCVLSYLAIHFIFN